MAFENTDDFDNYPDPYPQPSLASDTPIVNLFCKDWENEKFTNYQPESIDQMAQLGNVIESFFYHHYGNDQLIMIFTAATKKRMAIWQGFASVDRFSSENFTKMDFLPEDSELVVRTKALKDFVIRNSANDFNDSNDLTSKPKNNKQNGYTERHAKNRELILGAAFAVLSKWPENCKDKQGNISASEIAKTIEIQWKNLIPPRDCYSPPPIEPSHTTEGIQDLIRDWITKVNTPK